MRWIVVAVLVVSAAVIGWYWYRPAIPTINPAHESRVAEDLASVENKDTAIRGLAAKIPAVLATVKASPLARVPAPKISVNSGEILIEPWALAKRWVGALAETSTIWARPWSLKWVSFEVIVTGLVGLVFEPGQGLGLATQGWHHGGLNRPR